MVSGRCGTLRRSCWPSLVRGALLVRSHKLRPPVLASGATQITRTIHIHRLLHQRPVCGILEQIPAPPLQVNLQGAQSGPLHGHRARWVLPAILIRKRARARVKKGRGTESVTPTLRRKKRSREGQSFDEDLDLDPEDYDQNLPIGREVKDRDVAQLRQRNERV